MDHDLADGPREPLAAEVETGDVEGPGWGWRHVGLALLAFIVGGALVVMLARFLSSLLSLPPGGSLIAPAAYIATAGLYLALLLGIYLFGARRAGWAALGLRRTGWRNIALVPLIFLLGLATLVGVNLLVAQLNGGSFENPQVEALTGGKAMSPPELLAGLLLIAGLVPFVEELFFRGMIYPLLRQRAPVALAIVANAGLFAVAHVVPLLIPGLFVVGLFLAFLRERSGSIWPSVLFHAMQNGLALLVINAALASGAL